MGAGITTGCLAILSAQPTDVVKIRMQAEVIAPGAKSRYNGVLHAYATVAREEGLRGLYKGKQKSHDCALCPATLLTKVRILYQVVCRTSCKELDNI